MRAPLVILWIAFAAYSVEAYLSPAKEAPAGAAQREGMRLWQQHNCAACHQLYGLGGYMGPDLTNVMERKGDGHVRTFIRYGTGRMPAHVLSDADLDALVAFLAWVDRSGTARVPPGAVHWTGTYIIEER